VEYLPPLGTIGRLLLDGMIRKKLNLMFDYLHETTGRLLQENLIAGRVKFDG